MPWIENVSKADVAKAHHFDPGPNSMLICINDIACEWVVPKFNFKNTQRFEFLDVEDTDITWCPEEAMISCSQAARLVSMLTLALHDRMNVVVQCTAGICRSGAIAEVGIMMGFQDTEKWRSPNLRVKRMMLQELGLVYDPNEQHRVKPNHYDYLDPRREINV